MELLPEMRAPRSATRFLAPLAFLLSLAACGGAPKKPRLVLLYGACTVNRSCIGPYGDVSYTPNLDAFAAESVVFERHMSESGQSGISFASIFTGSQADRHGIYDHPNRLDDSLYLITEAFRDAGFDPWFFSGHQMASYDLNYGQGVERDHVFQPAPPRKREKIWSFLQRGNPLTEKLLKRLREDPDYRAFVLCNFTVSHGRYEKQIPAEEYDAFLASHPEVARGLTRRDLDWAWGLYGAHRFDLQWAPEKARREMGLSDADQDRFERALEWTYRADLAFLDGMFGRTLRLLEEEGLRDESLIAFTADHGETFARPGTLFHWTHGLQLAPEVLEVPWILSVPGGRVRPGRYGPVTRSIDVFPTLAGLCGIDLGGRGVEGVDLSGALLGRERQPHLLAFSHTTKIGTKMQPDFARWEETSKYFASDDVDRIWVQVREGDWVLKWRNFGADRWGAQAFDLSRDPLELTDLFDEANRDQGRQMARARGYKALLVSRFGRSPSDSPDDALQRLQELGYVESGDREQ